MSRVVAETDDPKILGAMVEAPLVYPEHFEAGPGHELLEAL